MNMSYWPFQSYLELGALPSAVPSARLHARLVVSEWGLGEIADTVELIVSELVTNGVQASKGMFDSRWQGRWVPGVPPVRLWLQADQRRVLIQVWDGSEGRPHRQESDSNRESGHGLVIVETLSAQVGVYLLEDTSGKVVWAKVRVASHTKYGDA
jgi:anti-sigma regulatory factor (Ser/Thr protein kinase)